MGGWGGGRGREGCSGEASEGCPRHRHSLHKGLEVGTLLSWNVVLGREITFGKCAWNQVRVGLESPAKDLGL